MPQETSSRAGSVMLEFSLSALPLTFAVISLMWMSMGMWQYHTLAEAVNVEARTAAVHGADCAGQTCSTTVDTTARALAAKAIGIPAGQMNVTLTSQVSTITCNPLTSCYGNSTAWPSITGNTAATTNITLKATYQFSSAISMYVPGKGVIQFSAVTFGAQAQQPVVY